MHVHSRIMKHNVGRSVCLIMNIASYIAEQLAVLVILVPIAVIVAEGIVVEAVDVDDWVVEVLRVFELKITRSPWLSR